MLQGFTGQDDEGHYLVITADDAGLDAFQSRQADVLDRDGRVPHAYQYLTDDRLRGFSAAYLFESLIDIEVTGIARALDIKLLSRLRAQEAQAAMLAPPNILDDPRPIRTILGLDRHDPWAKPTPNLQKTDGTTDGGFTEENGAGAEVGKRPQDWCFGVRVREGRVWARFARIDLWETQALYPGVFILADLYRAKLPPGWLTEERANEFLAHVHHTAGDLRNALVELGFVSDQSIWTDGACDKTAEEFTLRVDDPLEVRRIAKLFGVPIFARGDDFVTVDARYAGNLTEALQRRSIAFRAPSEIPPTSPPDILARRPFKAFYRLDLHGVTLETALDVMTQSGQDVETVLLGWGEDQDTAWFAVAVERLAKEYRDLLVEQCTGITTEIYRADTHGARQDPRPAIEAKATGPRPWRDGGEWASLTREQREAEIKTIEPSEFLFTGRYDADRKTATFYFAPEEYFDQHGEMWHDDRREVLDSFMPRTFTPQEPGVYTVATTEFNYLVFTICRAGFRESNRLRMYLNDL